MNLDKIIEQVTGEDTNLLYSGNLKDTKDCMKEAVRQALEEACERATLTDEKQNAVYGRRFFYNGDKCVMPDKESIMKVMEEIE